MNRELPDVKAPVSRPTRAHTLNFNMSYKGARLLGGECKGTQPEHEKAILVFHSLDQLAFKDKPLALLTTNNSFTFFNSWVVDTAAYVQTCYHELKKLKLGPISNIKVDLDKNAEHLKLPPCFSINGNAFFVENDKKCLEVWGKLWSEVRGIIGDRAYFSFRKYAQSTPRINLCGHHKERKWMRDHKAPGLSSIDKG